MRIHTSQPPFDSLPNLYAERKWSFDVFQCITEMIKYMMVLLLSLAAHVPVCGQQPTVNTRNDSLTIKVHFLYGSRPLARYRPAEMKWFGGKLGGHAGIEVDTQRILNFVPNGNVRWFENNKHPNGVFIEDRWNDFRESLGGIADSNKTATIIIPITKQQKAILDSIAKVYQTKSPYDYAFFGMRCGAAAADVLEEIGILHNRSHRITWLKYFYPKRLRKKLFRMAKRKGWEVLRYKGTTRRKWERN
jgi:hypothetical protein